MKKCWRRTAVIGLSLLLFLLISLSVLVITGGFYTGFALDSRLDSSLFYTGDRTTRLFYQNEDGEPIELSSDRISGYENALYCPLSEMSEDLKNAFIAIEDKRFYDHGGIDWLRTGSAMLHFVRGDGCFGGSTITQQLVKNLTGDDQRSVKRKLAEMVRAARLEEMLSKEQILEQYLNVVNLAESCYGVRTAANAYFSKEPCELTLREAATIAAITNNPTRYDPIRAPESNRARRDLILAQMLEQEMIDRAAYEDAVAEPTVLCLDQKAFSGRVNSWFADHVVRDVIADLVRERNMSEAAASRLVYGGGLKIYTTVDPRLQEAVEAYYRNAAHFPEHAGGKRAQSAILIVDPATGDVLAVAGAVGEKAGNRLQSFATDTRRPSGSVIKPLSVYAPALQRGLITWATVFDDVPHSFRANGAPWPRNAPNVYRGLSTVNTALIHSINTVSVSVLERLGSTASFSFLHEQLGFSSLERENDSGIAALALGQQHEGVTLRELVGGYTALANGGVYVGTRCYTRVEDSAGQVLLERQGTARRVLDADNAAIMTMMLRQAVQSGTGRAITLKEQVDVAGKTGTSSNSCDKWFIGYTPELLAGVWYGYEYPESLSDVSGNPALHVFDDLMHRAVEIRGIEKRQFDTDGDLIAVRYCRDSGMLMSDACHLDPRGDRSEIGYFKRGTEPHQVCGCHTVITYCRHGGVACEDCPAEDCYQVGLLRVLRRFPRQIRVLDAPYTCNGSASKNGRELSFNEPYYAEIGQTKRFYGIEMGAVPFNRICPVHTINED
ncbi:MAG: transglycosylase domain-containing protein, partial [Clostridia bacterium]|nr:transglycosylase domain-containing protein [Clostridia bacterium]